MENSNALPARTLEELGAEVKSARERKKLSIDDVALATCIRSNFLEDIEKGDFSKFKARVYARGFVHAYVDFIGAGNLWDEYSELLTEAVLAPARVESPRQSYPGGGRRVSMQPPASAVAPTHGYRFSSLRRVCAILICVIAVAALAGLFGNWDRIKEEIARIQNRRAYDGMVNVEVEKAQHEQKKKAEEEAVARAREAQAKAEAEAKIAEAKAAAEKAAAEKTDASEKIAPSVAENESSELDAGSGAAQRPETQTVAPAATEPGKPALAMRAKGECWIQINRGKEILISTTVDDGWEATYELDDPLLVRLGNAQEISISTDGENFTQLTGGVVRYEVRPDGTMRRIARRTE